MWRRQYFSANPLGLESNSVFLSGGRNKDSVMNGNMHSQSANAVDPVDEESSGTLRSAVEAVQGKKENDGYDYSQGGKRFGERIEKEVRDRLGPVVGDEMLDEMFDEDDSAEVQVLDEEEIVRGTRGVGAVWKMSLFATISFATYVLLSGPSFQPKWIPDITERDVIPKIIRARNRKK